MKLAGLIEGMLSSKQGFAEICVVRQAIDRYDERRAVAQLPLHARVAWHWAQVRRWAGRPFMPSKNAGGEMPVARLEIGWRYYRVGVVVEPWGLRVLLVWWHLFIDWSGWRRRN